MASPAFKLVEQLLEDYPHYDKEITKRKLALAYPVREVDENIGGSHVSSNTSLAERYVVTLDQDSRIRMLEKQQKVIGKCLMTLSEEELKVIRLRYFHGGKPMKWEDVAQKSLYSKSQCLRIRNYLVNEIGRKLDLMD